MNDFYRRLIKEELYQYQMLKDSLPYVVNQIEELESRKTSKLVSTYGTQPMKDGGSSQEDKLININAKIDLLKRNKAHANDHIARIESALDRLSERQKDIVLKLHGRRGKRDGVLDSLTRKYHYEKSQLYRIADEGLERMSFYLYGDA